MSSQNVELIFEAKDAACFKVAQGKRELFARGELNILRHGSDGSSVVILMVKNFQYPLRPDIPVLKAAPRTYIFTCPGQIFYGVIIPESVSQELVLSFEEILGNESDLHMTEVVAEEEVPYPKVPQVVESIASKPVEKQGGDEPAQIIEGEPSSPSTALKISKVESKIEIYSQLTVKGLISGARVIGGTVKKGGKFVISKVPPNQTPSKVSKYTKSIIRFAKSTYVSSFKDKLNSAIETGVDVVSSTFNFALAKTFTDTEFGKKIVNYENPTLSAAKSAAATTMTAVDSVLLAAFEASNIILKDLGDATSEIVEHRYGKEVGDTSKEVFSLTTDLVEVTRNAYRTGITSLASAVTGGDENDEKEEEEEETKGGTDQENGAEKESAEGPSPTTDQDELPLAKSSASAEENPTSNKQSTSSDGEKEASPSDVTPLGDAPLITMEESEKKSTATAIETIVEFAVGAVEKASDEQSSKGVFP